MPVINSVVYPLLSSSCWEKSSRRWTGLNSNITCSAIAIWSPVCGWGSKEVVADQQLLAAGGGTVAKGAFLGLHHCLFFLCRATAKLGALCRIGLLMFHPLNVWEVQWFLNIFVPLHPLISKVYWPTDKCAAWQTGTSKTHIHSFRLWGPVPIKLKS